MIPTDSSADSIGLSSDDVDDRRDERGPERSRRPSDDQSRPLLTCLVVSHDEDVRSLLDSMLKVRRHQVTTCDPSQARLLDIVELAPHLAVIDWRLPDAFAVELVERIQSDGHLASSCQILAVAGSKTGSEISTILDSGCCDVLSEPLDPATVEARIRVHEHIAGEFLKLEKAFSELRQSHERLLISCGGQEDGLWDADLRTGDLTLSPEWEHLLGPEMERQTTIDEWLEFIDEEDRDRIRQLVESVARGELQSLEEHYRLVRPDDTRRRMCMLGETVRDPGGEAMRLVCRHSDVTDDKAAFEEPRTNLLIDPLTRLASRTVLLDRLRHAFARASRMKDKPFAVLFFDIDRFKNVNDSLGHLVGDKLLMAIADRVRSICRPSDTVCRFGGDEFVIFAEDVESVRDATSIAGRLHQEFQVPFDLDESEAYATVSTGIAMWHPGYEKPENLLRDADNAMYRAKELGRNRYAVFDEKMHAEVVRTLELENDLRRAVARKEFRPFYQPIISLDKGNLVGFEVLARWDHPTRGLVLPGEFIQASEEMGEGVALTVGERREQASLVGQVRRDGPFAHLPAALRQADQRVTAILGVRSAGDEPVAHEAVDANANRARGQPELVRQPALGDALGRGEPGQGGEQGEARAGQAVCAEQTLGLLVDHATYTRQPRDHAEGGDVERRSCPPPARDQAINRIL